MKPTPSKFKLGLIQMSCGLGVEENLQKALIADRPGSSTRRADHLSAGIVPVPVFLPEAGRNDLRSG